MAQKDALSREYEEICNIFLEEGADFFVFETFSEMEELLPAIKMIGEQAFITVQFSVNQFGYSNAGLSARKLLQRAGEVKEIDAVGFNCGVGPSHMHRILQILEKPEGKLLTPFPMRGILRWSSAVCSSPGITKTFCGQNAADDCSWSGYGRGGARGGTRR